MYLIAVHLSPLAAAASSDGSSSILTQVFTGIAMLIGAYTAYRLSRRDSNANELRDAVASLKTATDRIEKMQADMLSLRNYIFAVRSQFADAGIVTPEPPVLRSGPTA